MLLLALALGLLIGLPQIIPTLRYYPKSIRAQASYRDKVAIGKVGWRGLWCGLFNPLTVGQVDGVFYPEMCASIGLIGLFCALFSQSWHQWMAFYLFLLLATGSWLFRLLSPFMLRIPARWMYFVGVTLAFMAVDGAYQLNLPPILLLLQAAYLLVFHVELWPMREFTQRWERPSWAFREARIDRFPCRTGYIHHLKTLGYSGGSMLKAMARFRGITDPNGESDWDGSRMRKEDLAWWKEGHTWQEMEARYGER